ncbi:MAG: ribonuclease P protein component [Dysgonamonadaceae bacterium]|nr:ribonuclease P protein component [Dysgonamonadaceae bacterium]
MNHPNTFRKEERISLQTEIDALFTEGKSFVSYPLRIIYLRRRPASGERVSILISVPKKRLKRAVKRNRIKRLIREAYRKNKSELAMLPAVQQSGLLISFIFLGNVPSTYSAIETSIKHAFIELATCL